MDTEKKYIVYLHKTPNGKYYVGITSQIARCRWRSDGSGYSQCKAFYRAIKKYGWDNIEHAILETGLTLDEANEAEKKYISMFRSNDRKYGYNLTGGGGGICGFKMSDETRNRMSATRTGVKHTKEWNENISKALSGKHPSKETLIKLSESHKGKKLSDYAKSVAVENLAKNAEKTKKQIVRVDGNGDLVEYSSISEAARELNCPSLKKDFKRAVERHHKIGGYYWQYKEVE